LVTEKWGAQWSGRQPVSAKESVSRLSLFT
jgi:hypothetical protein